MLPKFTIIVNLAIEDDPDSLVFIGHGLLPPSQVNNRQAAHSKTNVALTVDALIIRASMGHHLAHLLDACLNYRL